MRNQVILFAMVLTGALAVAAPLMAQANGPGDPSENQQSSRRQGWRKGRSGPGMGLRQATRLALFQHLYPIRLIRQNAQEIGLTDRQTKRIQQVVSAARSDIEKRKWDYARETKKLTELVEQNASKNKYHQ